MGAEPTGMDTTEPSDEWLEDLIGIAEVEAREGLANPGAWDGEDDIDNLMRGPVSG